MNEITFGERVRYLRERRGLTQKEMAGRLKVDAITVSRWERGVQHPSELAMKQLDRLERR